MQRKLTLWIDSELIQFAKRYARNRGKSLSQMTAEFYSLLSILESEEERKTAEMDLPPITRFLKGLLRKSDVTIEGYQRYLEEKYQ